MNIDLTPQQVVAVIVYRDAILAEDRGYRRNLDSKTTPYAEYMAAVRTNNALHDAVERAESSLYDALRCGTP